MSGKDSKKTIKKPVETKSTVEYTPGSDKLLTGQETTVQAPIGDAKTRISTLSGSDSSNTDYNKTIVSADIGKGKAVFAHETSTNETTGTTSTTTTVRLGSDKLQRGGTFNTTQTNNANEDSYSASALGVIKVAPSEKFPVAAQGSAGGGLKAGAEYLDDGNTRYSVTGHVTADVKGELVVNNSVGKTKLNTEKLNVTSSVQASITKNENDQIEFADIGVGGSLSYGQFDFFDVGLGVNYSRQTAVENVDANNQFHYDRLQTEHKAAVTNFQNATDEGSAKYWKNRAESTAVNIEAYEKSYGTAIITKPTLEIPNNEDVYILSTQGQLDTKKQQLTDIESKLKSTPGQVGRGLRSQAKSLKEEISDLEAQVTVQASTNTSNSVADPDFRFYEHGGVEHSTGDSTSDNAARTVSTPFNPSGESITLEEGSSIYQTSLDRNIVFDEGVKRAYEEANPHIEDITKVPAGTKVNVPSEEQIKESRETVKSENAEIEKNQENTPDQSSDVEGDGTIDYQDTDSNANGLPDSVEVTESDAASSSGETDQDGSFFIPTNNEPTPSLVEQWSELTGGAHAEDQRQAGQALTNSVNSFYSAVKQDDFALGVKAGIDFTVALDNVHQAQEVGEQDTLLSNSASAKLNIASAGIGLGIALDNGDTGDIIVSGFTLATSIDGYQDLLSEGSGFIGDGAAQGIGGAVAAYSLYNAIKADDAVGAVTSGLQLYNTFQAGASKIPGLAYVGAFVSLLEGDIEGAILSAGIAAATPALIAAGPVGWVALAVLSIFGPLLFGSPPPPEAWSEFSIGENGEIDFDVKSNETGEGLEEQVDEFSQALVSTIESLQNRGVDVQTRFIPKLGLKEKEWYLKHTAESGVDIKHKFDDPSQIFRGFQDGIIFSGMYERGETAFSFPNPFRGETDWSDSIQGTGQQAGGGNVGGKTELVVATKDTIRTINPKPATSAQEELKSVQQSWRIDKGLFSGENGALLAMGIATGVVNIETVVAAALPEVDEIDLVTDERYKEIIAEYENFIAAGVGVFGDVETFDAQSAIAPTDEYREDISQFYSRRVATTEEENETLQTEALNFEFDNNINVNETQSSEPVFFTFDEDGAVSLTNNDIPSVETNAIDIEEEIVEQEEADAPFIHQLNGIEDRDVWYRQDTLLQEHPDYDVAWVFQGFDRVDNGSLLLNAQGEIQFIPDADFNGRTTLSYSILDESGNLRSIDVAVDIENANDRPDAVDDEVELVEDQRFDLSKLLENDIDIDNDTLRIVAVSAVSVGQIVIVDGKAQYEPPKDFVGEVTLSYIVEDSNSGSPQRSVASSVLTYKEGNNDLPEASDTVLTDGVEDEVYRFNATDLLQNASDAEGDELTLVDIRLLDDTHGTISYDQDSGEIVFTPATHFSGDAQFTYDIAEVEQVLNADGDIVEELGEIVSASLTLKVADVVDQIATDDHAITINEDAQIILTQAQLLTMVDNPGGEEVSVSAVRMISGEFGQVHRLDSGDVLFIPAPEFSGDTAFEVRLTTGEGDERQRIVSRVDVTVNAVADAPSAVDDVLLGGVEEQLFSFNVAELKANDVDSEGDDFSITSIALSDDSQGSLEFNQATELVNFTPATDFFGQVEFVYTATETISGLFSQGKATLLVSNVNDKPVISLITAEGAEDTLQVFSKEQLLADYAPTFLDKDGEALSISGVSLSDPAAGSVTVNTQGGIEFMPAQDYTGSANIEYLVDDGAMPVTASIDVTVTPENDAPNLVSEQITGATEDEDFVFTIADLLGNDSDVEGDTITLNSVRLVDESLGSVSVNHVSGEIRFTPAANVFGEVAFEYEAQDESGLISIVTSTVVVSGADDAFEVANKVADLLEDQVRVFSKDELLSDYSGSDFKDVDGESLTITAARVDPSFGMVSVLADGGIEFTPADQYAGEALVEYDVSDGVSTQSVQLTINIEAENDAPEAVEDILTGGVEDQVFTFAASDILSNDSDEEGDQFSLKAVRLLDQAQGELIYEEQTGVITFTPALDVFGEIAFDYDLEDENENLGTGTSKIVIAGVDDPFIIHDKDFKTTTFNVTEDEQVVFNKTDLLIEYAREGNNQDNVIRDRDGEELTISNVNMVNAALGSAILNIDGDIVFTPAQDYNGEAAFSFDVSDGNTISSVTINTKTWGVNDAPAVEEDSRTVVEDTTLSVSGVSLLINDRDVEGDDFTIAGIWNQSQGSARYDSQTDTLFFTPEADQNTVGSDAAWVEYIVEDSRGAHSIARLNVDINNADDPVIAVDDVIDSNEDEVTIFQASDFFANDMNLDNEVLTIQSIDTTSIEHGTLELLADGTVQYTPESEYHGEQNFSYTVSDESGNLSTAEANLKTKEVNDAPLAQTQHEVLKEDIPITFKTADLLNNISDVEDDWVSIVGARSKNGSVDFNEYTGEIHFTPTLNFNSVLNGENAQVEYLVVDERGAETWAPIDIDVTPVNDPPLGVDDLVFAWESGPNNYTNPILSQWLLANDEEYDGETIFIDQVTQGGQANVSLSGGVNNNTVVGYQANANFIGQDQFTYRVSDGMLNEDGTESVDHTTVTIQVENNHAPVAYDFLTVAPEDTPLVFDWADIEPHVIDVDTGHLQLSEDLKVVAVDGATNGSVTLDNARVIFTPTQDYNSVQHGGVATFNYTVEDIVGHRSTATASINYTPVNDRPVAQDEHIGSIDEDSEGIEFTLSDLMNNDYDVDEDELIWGNLRVSNNSGLLTHEGGETYRFVPAKDWNGTANVEYQVTDGELVDTAYANITVNPLNDRPVVTFDSAGGDDSGRNFYSISQLLSNDYDVDGDSLRITNVQGHGGSAGISGGNLYFDANRAGSASITYTVDDGNGGRTGSRLDLNIIHINRAPHALNHLGGGVYDGRDYVWFRASDVDTSYTNLSYNLNNITGADGIIAFTGSDGVFNIHYYANSSTISFNIGVSDGEHYRTFNKSVAGRLIYDYDDGEPVVIDLNGDGLQLTNVVNSSARYDWNSDGRRLEQTGWIAGLGDGILAYDFDGDGEIKHRNEIAFIDYLEGAQTDLEGLRAFDSNSNGLFDIDDEKWLEFGLWVDDGDALSEEGEFQSLEDFGIQSINLFSDEKEESINGNTVHGITEVMLTDGSSLQAGDVTFSVINHEPELLFTAANDEIFAVSEDVSSEETSIEDSIPDITEARSIEVVTTDDLDLDFVETEPNSVDGVSDLDNVNPSFDLELPSDEELDRMAMQNASDAAAMPSSHSVPEIDANPDAQVNMLQEEDEPVVSVA